MRGPPRFQDPKDERSFTIGVKNSNLYSMKSRISSKGQITVPAAVREALGLVAGTAVEFIVGEGEAVIRKRTTVDPVDRVYGRLNLGARVDRLVDEMRGPRPAMTRRKRARKRTP
jgi:AbrB family looped-hinge helix DNA binding protein